MKTPGVVVIAIVLAGCASNAEKAPEVVGPVAEAAAAQGAGDAATRGRELFLANCHRCHSLKAPASRTPEKWEGILPRMTKRAHLTPEQAADVKAYILAANAAATQAAAAPKP
jgi:mono/diheme cytochrome c family protein